MLERDFQVELKTRLEHRFPGCLILKQDPNQRQGIPDWLVLYEDKWAFLETKKGSKAKRQPNQEYYVGQLNNLSFAAFIDPDNIDDVLDDLERRW